MCRHLLQPQGCKCAYCNHKDEVPCKGELMKHISFCRKYKSTPYALILEIMRNWDNGHIQCGQERCIVMCVGSCVIFVFRICLFIYGYI